MYRRRWTDMTCNHDHNDPNDHPSLLHIASCYAAYETYVDVYGHISEKEFNASNKEKILAMLLHIYRPQTDEERMVEYD